MSLVNEIDCVRVFLNDAVLEEFLISLWEDVDVYDVFPRVCVEM